MRHLGQRRIGAAGFECELRGRRTKQRASAPSRKITTSNRPRLAPHLARPHRDAHRCEIAVTPAQLGKAEHLVGLRRAETPTSDDHFVVVAGGLIKIHGRNRARRQYALAATRFRSMMSAFSATATAGISAEGSASARLPQVVPRLRTAIWATCGIASASSGTRCAIKSPIPARRHGAPVRRCELPLPRSAMPRKRIDPVDIDQHPGRRQPHVERRHQALPAGQHLCARRHYRQATPQPRRCRADADREMRGPSSERTSCCVDQPGTNAVTIAGNDEDQRHHQHRQPDIGDRGAIDHADA